MKCRTGIFFLLLIGAFVALPMDAVFACGDQCNARESVEDTKQQHCCAAKEGQGCCSIAAAESGTEKDCSGEKKDSNHCHCPGCGHTTVSPAGYLASPFFITFTASPCEVWLTKQAFYFSKHLPEDVILPIWQPPQLGC
jgi:hypothetical protein